MNTATNNTDGTAVILGATEVTPYQVDTAFSEGVLKLADAIFNDAVEVLGAEDLVSVADVERNTVVDTELGITLRASIYNNLFNALTPVVEVENLTAIEG